MSIERVMQYILFYLESSALCRVVCDAVAANNYDRLSLIVELKVRWKKTSPVFQGFLILFMFQTTISFKPWNFYISKWKV